MCGNCGLKQRSALTCGPGRLQAQSRTAGAAWRAPPAPPARSEECPHGPVSGRSAVGLRQRVYSWLMLTCCLVKDTVHELVIGEGSTCLHVVRHDDLQHLRRVVDAQVRLLPPCRRHCVPACGGGCRLHVWAVLRPVEQPHRLSCVPKSSGTSRFRATSNLCGIGPCKHHMHYMWQRTRQRCQRCQ